MHTSTETTLADLAGLTPENYRRDLAELDKLRRRLVDEPKPTVPTVRSKRRRAGKSEIVATRRPRTGRPVLRPGTRKAARHPWADRLHAARTGGFTVGRVFTNTDRVTASCFACGDRFTIAVGAASATDRAGFEAECRRHEARECVNGAEL